MTSAEKLPLNKLLKSWQKYEKYAFARWITAQVMCWKAPYFRTIRPKVISLELNRAVVGMRKRHAVHNHIKTVHAIAVCNLVELAMGFCAESSIPVNLRWIPVGMDINYLAKAATDLTAEARVDSPWAPGVMQIKFVVRDAAGIAVADGHVRIKVSEKPKKS